MRRIGTLSRCVGIILLGTAGLTVNVAAQYGDAYHAPDYNRLRQMADARAAAAREAHALRTAPTKRTPATGMAASSGAGDANSWGMTGRISAQRRAGERIDARQAAHEAKETRLRALIRERGIRVVPEDYERLQQAAIDAGFDAYLASRRFGATREDLARYQASIAASLGLESAASPRRVTAPAPDCPGSCSATVESPDGSVYTGNIRNGAADGQGTMTYRDGSVDSGTWRNGALHGDGRSTTTGTVFIGRFDNGRRFSGRLEILQPKSVFEGVFDSAQAPAIGTITSPGWAFTGEFRSGMRYRGTIDTPVFTQVGTFDAQGRIRAGRVTTKADGSRTDGYYDERTLRHGYAVDVFADQSSNEMIFDHDRRTGPVIRTRANGEVITGVTNMPGYQIFGVLVGLNGSVTPTGLTANGQYVTLPPADHERARTLAAQSATTLMAERMKYRAMMEAGR